MSGFRILTEQNLSSVLQEVDPREPHASPLLEAVQGLHGGSPRPLLFGAFAEQQQAALRKWILRAAAESADRDLAQAPAADPEPNPVVPAASASEDVNQNAEAAAARVPAPGSDPFLEQILAEERPDRFDPEVFNRMMHTRAPVSHRSR